MNPSVSSRRVLPRRRVFPIALVLAAMALSLAFLTALPTRAYAANCPAEVGYIQKDGTKVSTGTVNSLNDLSRALEENSSKGEGGAYAELQGDFQYWSGELIQISGGKKATIYLNGHVIDGSHSSETAFFANGGQLTIEGGNKSGQAVLTRHDGYIDQTRGSGKLWKQGSNSSKTAASIEGGLLTAFSNNALRVAEGGRLTIKNVTIAGNTTNAPINQYRSNNTLELYNSSIKWNSGNQGGGLQIGKDEKLDSWYDNFNPLHTTPYYVYSTNVSCVLDNTSITENIGNDGGGICGFRAEVYLTLRNGSKVDNNYAKGNGGGIFLNTRSTYVTDVRDDHFVSDTTKVVITGGSEVSGNYACSNGGGIYGIVQYENTGGRSVRGHRSITVDERSKISDNTAGNHGGGVYLQYDERTEKPTYPYLDFVVKGSSEVSNNKARQGGGVYMTGTAWQQISVSGAHIDGNEATNGNGGGIFTCTRISDISLVQGATVNNNKASQSGGGVASNSPNLDMTMDDASQVNGNIATASEGGGVCVWGDASAKIAMLRASQIAGNRAQVRGGGVSFVANGECSISYDETSVDYEDDDFGVGVISYNAVLATDRETKGGGVYCSSPTVTLRNVDINHNSLDSKMSGGGGVYIDHSSTFLVNCSITNNKTAGNNGGGVEVAAGSTSAFAILGGKVVVKDNANGSGERSNVHVAEKASNKSDVENDNNQYNNRIAEYDKMPLTSDSFIGLQHWTGTDAAKHAVSAKGQKIVASASLFSADDYDWSVEKANDVIWLVKKRASYNLTLYTTSLTDAAKVETKEYNSTVTIDNHDWSDRGNVPDYWTAEGLGSTTKLVPDEFGKVSFTMPHNNVVLRAHYKACVAFLNIGIEDSNSLTDGDSSQPILCSGIAVEDSNGVRYIIPEDYPQIDAAKLVKITRTYYGKDDFDNRSFDYTATVDAALATKLDLATLKDKIEPCISTLHDANYAQSYSADSKSVEVKDDGSIVLVFRYVFPSDPETTDKAVTVNLVDENTKNVLLSDKQFATLGGSFTWNSSAYVSRLTGATWVLDEQACALSDGWSLKDGVLSKERVEADAQITLYVKPQVTKVTVALPQLTVGQTFPTKVSSYVVLDSADPAKSRDITELVNQDVKIAFTTLDGQAAGDTVKADTPYRVTITTAKLAQDGYAYAAPATMTNTQGNSCVVLNGQTGGVSFAGGKNGYVVTGQVSGEYSTDFDKQVTTFPKTRVNHAAECLGILPKEAKYQLKNMTSHTSDITWDTSAVDDTMTSGEFTVYGSYVDVNGKKHDVSQVFYLASLYAPTATPNDLVNEDSQTVTLLLDSSFKGVSAAQIWYCVKVAGEQPGASDYRLYSEPFVINKAAGRDQVVYAYAKVGERKTDVNSFEYIFASRHSVEVLNGVAKDGEGNVITSALENQDVFIYANDAIEGESFLKWELYAGSPDIEDANAAQTSFCMPDSDVVVMAQYSVAKYTVSFNTQGGSEVAQQSIYHGGVATKPGTDPVREGYEFKGWYADAACTQVFDFTQPIKANTTVFAKWAGLVTVSFDAAGGSSVDNVVIENGASLGTLPITSRDGHFFVGWYNGQTRVTASTKFDASVTLTAHWQPLSSTVYFMDGYKTLGQVLVEYGKTVLQPASPTKTGYVFAGWYTDRDFTQAYDFTQPVVGPMSLYAKWNANTYTVSFLAGEGVVVAPQTVEYGQTATRPSDPVRNGYVFKGWYADADCTVKFDFSAAVTADATVFAKWAKLVTVSFDAAGGSAVDAVELEQGSGLGNLPVSTLANHIFCGWYTAAGAKVTGATTFEFDTKLTAKWDQNVYFVQYLDEDGETTLDIDNAAEGERLVRPNDPVREGYKFLGWYTNATFSALYDFDMPVTSDFDLYAGWECNRYTVGFDSLGGSPVESRQIAHGDTVVAPADPKRDGYEFEGWYTDANCTRAYDFNTAVKAPMTLYAKWTKLIEIVFDSNGGSDVGSLKIPTGGCIDGFPNTLRSGYYLEGWYLDGVQIPMGYAFDQDVTLVAHWLPEPMVVGFMDGDSYYDVAIVDYDDTVVEPEAPLKDGYVFLGWYQDKDLVVKYDFDTAVTKDFDLYAKWVPLVTVSFDANGGSSVASVQVKKGSALASLPISQKSNYIFCGWYLADGSKVTTSTTFDANTTIVAKWDQNVYFVSYLDSDGETTLDVDSVAEGDKLIRPADPVRDGYTFDGWYTDKSLVKLYDFDAEVHGDFELYAKWTKSGVAPDGPVVPAEPVEPADQAAKQPGAQTAANGQSRNLATPDTSDTTLVALPLALLAAALLALGRRFTR